MQWLRTDVFCFTAEMPNWIENQHLMVMGYREDKRVYYAFGPIPDHPSARPEAYKAIKAKFDSFLREPVTTEPFRLGEYMVMLDETLRKCKGLILDEFPTGE